MATEVFLTYLGGALRTPLYVCWGAVEKIRPKRVPNRVKPHFVKNTKLTVPHASMPQSKTRIRVYGSQRRIIASNVFFYEISEKELSLLNRRDV